MCQRAREKARVVPTHLLLPLQHRSLNLVLVGHRHVRLQRGVAGGRADKEPVVPCLLLPLLLHPGLHCAPPPQVVRAPAPGRVRLLGLAS